MNIVILVIFGIKIQYPMSSFLPDKFPVVYDKSEAQLQYLDNGAQEVPGSSPGGDSLFPVTGTGTATGGVTADMNGNPLTIIGNVGIGQEPTNLLDVIGEGVTLRMSAAAGTMIYGADNGHTFTGNVGLNQILNLGVYVNASPTDGDIWRDDNTNTGLKIRIDGVTKTITVS
jgi:hypothetical protein